MLHSISKSRTQGPPAFLILFFYSLASLSSQWFPIDGKLRANQIPSKQSILTIQNGWILNRSSLSLFLGDEGLNVCLSLPLGCHWVIHPSLLRPKMEVPLTLASIMDTYHSHVANQYFSVQNLTRQPNSWAHNSLPRFLRVWVRATPTPHPPRQLRTDLEKGRK